jgi:hypothetical protein
MRLRKARNDIESPARSCEEKEEEEERAKSRHNPRSTEIRRAEMGLAINNTLSLLSFAEYLSDRDMTFP